jgi:hypothetical protein
MLSIYGSSDDLIIVDGDELTEEFSGYRSSDESPRYLAFSDGTVLRVWYDAEGDWRVRREAVGTATYEHWPANGHPEAIAAPTYSDVAFLAGEFAWVVMGNNFHNTKLYARRKAAESK